MGFCDTQENVRGFSHHAWGKAFTMIALLLFFAVSSWGACYSGGLNESFQSDERWCSQSECEASCPSSLQYGSAWYTNGTVSSLSCNYAGANQSACPNYPWYSYFADYSCFYNIKCDTQSEADSVYCDLHSDDESCAPPRCDSTYTCTSVITENNVVRSEVTLKDCNDAVLDTRYVIGSCAENGFCEGSEVVGTDSCEYDGFDPEKCRNGGQNGSLCTYICPDGLLHTCHIAWDPGSPAEYQGCPSKPPSDCVAPRSSSSSWSGSVDDLPDSPGGGGGSSSSGPGYDPSSDCPECDILIAIRDTLHRANEQRRFQSWVLDTMKANIGGFGAQFDAIIGNTREQVNQANRSNNTLSSIASTNSQIVNKLNDIDFDNISVDSVVVHLDMAEYNPTTRDLDSLPVWRDTISEVTRLLGDINEQVDTLVQDSLGENALKKYLPYIKRIYEKAEDIYNGVGTTIPAYLDSIKARMDFLTDWDTLTSAQGQDYMDGLVRLSDSTYIDTTTPNPMLCRDYVDLLGIPSTFCEELDSAQSKSLLPPDSAESVRLFLEHDSILHYYDSLARDTTKGDTIGLQDLAGDSASIRQKLDFIFLPSNTVEQCFEFRLNTAFGRWTYNLFIDFADLFGLDLCDLIRKIVRLLTFILIVFTTIKGYIRAFGGGGPGGG